MAASWNRRFRPLDVASLLLTIWCSQIQFISVGRCAVANGFHPSSIVSHSSHMWFQDYNLPLRCPWKRLAGQRVKSSPSSASQSLPENNFDRPAVNGQNANNPDAIWRTPVGAHFSTLGLNWTPYHVLDPLAASILTSQSSPCSLYKSLRLFRRALEKLVQSQSEDLLDSLLPMGDKYILRLELELSHVVDPLAWLHAQQQRQQTSTIPQVYLKTELMEVAVFGAAYCHIHSSSSSGNERGSLWQLIIDQLPSNSQLYGGERFDTTISDTEMGNEWKRFGQAMWILPAIELRHDQKRPSSQQSDRLSKANTEYNPTIAIHLHRLKEEASWASAAERALILLQMVSSQVSDQSPTTTLPPVLSRESSYYDKGGNSRDGQELFEKGIMTALQEFEKKKLEKVVLARRMILQFGAHISALDILKRWKYGGQEGGHLFYLNPGQIANDNGDEDDLNEHIGPGSEFFGCTPERLFQIQSNSNSVISEALAGTRPRGTNQKADEELSRDLCASPKDVEENLITGRFIQNAFAQLRKRGWISYQNDDKDGLGRLERECVLDNDSRFFVRRLRHLQHICQRFEGVIRNGTNRVNIAKFLMERLHPTPAVAGYPAEQALEFIRKHESVGFDRGYYSGPFGYIGTKSVDILVAIRSGLVSHTRGRQESKVALYAGAGVVPGSTVHGEWAETSYKLEVVSSLFPQSPITLQGAPTPNVAWATAFLEELIRQGVTQFYVCPGSRSTPLVVALAKAVRSNVGVVHAISVHDERGAGFRAVGYGRGANRPAAVVTSSGTATANLYPSIMEAGVDGVPMLILTADRPHESRDTGANQAVDQVKAYSSSYIRWFRDIPPPSDDIPVSVALSDAGHAVTLTRRLKGPVHLNIQFRENLAPDGGLIRNDYRVDSMTKFNGFRFIDCPGFQRWSVRGGQWTSYFSARCDNEAELNDIARLIAQSKRGIIVVGNIRLPTNERGNVESSQMMEAISSFAQFVGFPIIAGVQAAGLRFSSEAVVPFAEHLLKHPMVAERLKPDLILQIGAPLVSSDVAKMITNSVGNTDSRVHHILLHPRHPYERADPGFTVSLAVSSEISPFLEGLMTALEKDEFSHFMRSSELAPLVILGRSLRAQMDHIIHQASRSITAQRAAEGALTEPQLILGLSKYLMTRKNELSLFLSNSMPVRDAESFLYPFESSRKSVLHDVGVNRGASGIDGVISSAAGFAEATQLPTTLLIGDLATLHDLNAFHTLARTSSLQSSGPPLTTVVVNNDGGGIFSFLPIAKHGSDVSFDEFFGTPTSSFSFEKGAEAFGLPFKQAATFASFMGAFRQAMTLEQASIVEAVVAGRDVNVAVHNEITKRVFYSLDAILEGGPTIRVDVKLPVKVYSRETFDGKSQDEIKAGKTLVVLHGWMGDKSDWDDVGTRLVNSLPLEWTVISVDLPGHGNAPLVRSSDTQAIRSFLGLGRIGAETEHQYLSVDDMASCILESLARDYGVSRLDAIAGYSLGGRVALAMMNQKDVISGKSRDRSLVTNSTKIILISASYGNAHEIGDKMDKENKKRLGKDARIAAYIDGGCQSCYLRPTGNVDQAVLWSDFLRKWYQAPIWGKLQNERDVNYQLMIERRWNMLVTRGRDLAIVIQKCSPPRQINTDWNEAASKSTLFIAGQLDVKYAALGRSIRSGQGHFVEVPKAGHALLVEASAEVAKIITNYLGDDNLWDEEIIERTPKEVVDTSIDGFQASPIHTVSSKRSLPFNDSDRVRRGDVSILEYKPFSILMRDSNRNERGVFGIGWGEKAQGSPSFAMNSRYGFILHLLSHDAGLVGIGEVSPLSGLHSESLKQAEEQLILIQSQLRRLNGHSMLSFDAELILELNGGMADFLAQLSAVLGVPQVLPSVRSGIEMALVSLAAQVVGVPVHQAIRDYSAEKFSSPLVFDSLPLNGLITRAEKYDGSLKPKFLPRMNGVGVLHFPSVKAKIGFQDAGQDVEAILLALSVCEQGGAVRADANRAWSDSRAIDFALSIQGIDFDLRRLEFIEEPLTRQNSGTKWTFETQVNSLEKWHDLSGIPYALDESMADLVEQFNYDFEKVENALLRAFHNGTRGCAAFVLKPSLLGLEFSLRLAKMGCKSLGIPSVVSSSFDSGVGLSYAAFLGAVSDATASKMNLKTFPHGLGTFCNLAEDVLSPPFASYVTSNGLLNAASLGNALYGLSLDEVICSFATDFETSEETFTLSPPSLPIPFDERMTPVVASAGFETTMSSNGRETNVQASLPLPFSADIGSSRFTDLPQQPRWSPWLSCVAYLDAPGRETEWTLNVRGAKFSWRAISQLLETPHKGIRWESVSGLQHRGMVEFVPMSQSSCLMRVRMTIMVPRIIATLFQGASSFLEDFLQRKLLKWSMEMFRDVVKGDLALERGDVELGDALFGAVEGKANAIEATLSPSIQDREKGNQPNGMGTEKNQST